MEFTKYTKSLNSILYSALETEITHVDLECTCDTEGHGDHAELKQLYPAYDENPFKKFENSHKKVYEKHVAKRYEAEYDYCMRWAADRKFCATRIIPFESNFYSVVRLLIKGRNWVLDCGNYDGQFDYCGWIPSPNGIEKPEIGNKPYEQLLTDSSLYTESDRFKAGRTSIHSSDTSYGLQSLKPETFEKGEAIDPMIYKLVGESKSDASQILDVLENLTRDESPVVNAESSKSKTSLGDLFYDLVELDQMFAKQVQQIEEQQQESVADNNFEEIFTYETCKTAASFSNVLVSSDEESGPSPKALPKPRNFLLNNLICLTGKKLGLTRIFSIKH